MKNPYLILLTLLTLLSLTHAQETSQRTCRIVFLDRPTGAPTSLHLYDGTSSQEVELPSMNLSPVYKIASGNIQLRLLATKVEDPNTVSPDAPSITIPESYTDFFLLVSSDPDNRIAPVSIKGLSPTSEAFKLGQMLWINLTDKTIKGKIGDQSISLNAESSAVVEAPRNDSGDYPVLLNYLIEGKDDVYAICETQWQHNPASRAIVIVSADKGRKAPRVNSYSDFR